MFKRLFLLLIVAIIALVAWEWITFPDVASLAKTAPATTAFMEQRKAELKAAGQSAILDYRFVPYARISPYLRRAVLVAEDNDFYEHNGVDVKGLEEALKRDWEKGKVTHGGSTITQQLAKNLYLSPSRNPIRKIREYFLARSLEKHLTKKRILELYLNVVEMGERVYGAEAASRHYFHVPASTLSPQQAALLGGCLPNPRIMNPGAPNKRLRWRQRMILSRMKRWGYAAEREVLTESKPAPKSEAPQPQTDTALEQTPANDTATPAEPPPTAPEPATETEPPPATESTPPATDSQPLPQPPPTSP